MKRHRSGVPPRAGVTLIAVLTLLTIATAVLGAWVRGALMASAAVRLEHQRTQADWLATSGLGRAQARLAADPAYGGETWDLPADELGQAYAARVTLTVVADGDRQRLTARVELPPGAARRVRWTKTLTLPPPQAGDTP